MRAQSTWLDEGHPTDNPPKVTSQPRSGSSFQELSNELHVLERTSDYVISTWRHVMFLAWCGRETAEGIARSRSLMEPWAKRKPGGVVLVILMPPPSALKQPPNEDARKAMADTSRDASDAFKGIAIISNETGFVGSVIRSVMTARQMFARSPVPFKMFSSAEEAAPWIARCLELQNNLRSEFSAAAERASWK
jgi:hypothetical protein